MNFVPPNPGEVKQNDDVYLMCEVNERNVMNKGKYIQILLKTGNYFDTTFAYCYLKLCKEI